MNTDLNAVLDVTSLVPSIKRNAPADQKGCQENHTVQQESRRGWIEWEIEMEQNMHPMNDCQRLSEEHPPRSRRRLVDLDSQMPVSIGSGARLCIPGRQTRR